MSMHPSRVVVIIAVTLAAIALIATGCPKPPAPAPPPVMPTPAQPAATQPTGEAIKVGAIFSVTGPGAPLGTPEKETVELVKKLVNDSGGINGRPLEVIVIDDQSDENQALSAAKRLLDTEKVVAVVGPTISGTSLAIMKNFEPARTPLVSCAASVKITQPVSPWVFSTAQTDVLAVQRLMEFLKAKKISKIAVLYDSNAFGKSGMDVLDKQAPENKITIVAKETFGSKDPSMNAQLTKIKGAGPQAVICWGTNPGPAIVAKGMKELKFDVPLYMSHGIANRKFIELAGEAANGVTFPAGKLLVADALPDSDPQRKVLLDYTKSFTDMYKKGPDTFGGHAWDAIQIVVKGLKEVGPDPVKLREAIEKTQGFVGVSGVFNLSASDHNGLTKDSFVMVTIKDGKWALVE